MWAMLFSDFVGMPTCVRNMKIKKVLKVAVGKMINDLMSVYQVSCQMPEFQQIHSQQDIQNMADAWKKNKIKSN